MNKRIFIFDLYFLYFEGMTRMHIDENRIYPVAIALPGVLKFIGEGLHRTPIQGFFATMLCCMRFLFSCIGLTRHMCTRSADKCTSYLATSASSIHFGLHRF